VGFSVNGTYGSFSQSGTASASSSHALSVALPFNHSDRDAVIRAVDLVGVRDIDILAIVATDGLDGPDGSCLAAGATDGFPPTAAQDGTTSEFLRHEIVGAIVPSERHRTCASHPSISVGVRRTGGTHLTGIEGVRLRYERAGVDSEVVLPSA
jgi:hypothetical protein